MTLGGSYDCVTKTPLGEQRGVLTIVPGHGDSFTGNITGDLGAMEIRNGRISGSTLSWRMQMTMPMPMEFDCTATIEGDRLTGTVKVAIFGEMEVSGTRRG